MKRFNKYGFIEKGFPYYGWLTAILSGVIRTAVNFKIPLIFYGEDGEVEYGGSTKNKNKALFDINYIKSIYLEGGYQKVFNLFDDIRPSQLYFWKFPSDIELIKNNISLTHWSYFEDWDSYRNYLTAKNFAGFKRKEIVIQELLLILLK